MSINKDILTPPTFLTYSLGCRTNQAEMEDICRLLSPDYSLQQIENGLQQPDLILLNTCVVTKKAEKETRQKINELRRKYPKSFLVVLGCSVTAKEKFNINIPNADLLISNEEKPNLFNILFDVLQNLSQTKLKPWYKNVDDRLLKLTTFLPNKYQQSGRKFIKIQEGCDRFCSFCLTAYLRGKPQSVPPEKTIEEINFWVKEGIKEIILTGINIGLYRSVIASEARQSQPNDITYLLNKILSETQAERLSFSSIDPEMLTDDFLKITIGNPRITQCFHLSLQSGSPTVLERMERKTDLSKLLKMLKIIKKQNPVFTFRADIITGFPDETEKEFQETLDFIKEAKISFVHPFQFSARPGTKMEGLLKSGKCHEVENSVKRQRAEMLKKVVEEIRNNEAKLMIDQLFHCLIVREFHCHSSLELESIENISIDSRSHFSDLSGMTTWEGITENGWPIMIKTQRSKDAKTQKLKAPLRPSILLGASKGQGKILPVKITDYEEGQLLGEILFLPT